MVDVRMDAATNASVLWDAAYDGQTEQVRQVPLLADGGVARLRGALLRYRVQLNDFTREVRAGTDVRMTFAFQRAGEISLNVPVEAVADLDGAAQSRHVPAVHPQRVESHTVTVWNILVTLRCATGSTCRVSHGREPRGGPVSGSVSRAGAGGER
ncbi:hypothetical protein [Nocardia sp. NRRL S-836]|uniref:hypothetical protein n=1 Tax=Nocardia sp. NRRL S-836 TaxID=1519492 RepID=UPI0006C391C6|nr:hypothetical protein [Nocardia sp. NRRL S-836]KOV87605.1 hypothetical protein ADL03_06850 [Nocardia sp. NRRL S-836]